MYASSWQVGFLHHYNMAIVFLVTTVVYSNVPEYWFFDKYGSGAMDRMAVNGVENALHLDPLLVHSSLTQKLVDVFLIFITAMEFIFGLMSPVCFESLIR